MFPKHYQGSVLITELEKTSENCSVWPQSSLLHKREFDGEMVRVLKAESWGANSRCCKGTWLL